MFLRQVKFAPGQGFATELKEMLQTTRLVHVRDGARADPRAAFERLAGDIGTFLNVAEDNTGERTSARWQDVKYDPKLEESFRFSKTAQPLHTDGSYVAERPEIVVFCCIRQAPQGGETLFLDAIDLVYHLNRESPELLDDLQHVPVLFRKGRTEGKLKPPITWDDRGPVLTWNYYRTESTTRNGKQMIDAFRDFLQERIVDLKRVTTIRLTPGEAVFFHDERLLHGRNAFTASSSGEREMWKADVRFDVAGGTP